VIAAGTRINIVVSSVINQQHEGSSGEFPVFTTLTAAGEVIDEASNEADSIGTVASAITFTPSTVSPVITPVSTIAGATTQLTLDWTTTNPLPSDGVIVFTIPDTFAAVAAASVAITSGIDGTFAVAQVGTATTYDTTLKTAGGPWGVTLTRQDDGAVVDANTQVVLVLSDVINQQHEGALRASEASAKMACPSAAGAGSLSERKDGASFCGGNRLAQRAQKSDANDRRERGVPRPTRVAAALPWQERV
jgi:hypothetical protein